MVSDSGPAMAGKGTILSGMRPTGRLHLGNYLGALENWVNLQQDYRCIYSIVDIHALTTIEKPDGRGRHPAQRPRNGLGLAGGRH